MENSPWMERIPNKATFTRTVKVFIKYKNTGIEFNLRSHKRSLTDLERIALRNRIKKGLSQFQLDQETSCDSPY